MAIILSIETATSSVCSTAIHENGKLLGVKELQTQQSAGSQLTVLIDELVNTIQLPLQEINAVAVSSGPGSYTGLRIGVSTAKGLCFGLNIPLIAIDSLLILAASVNQTSKADLLCPMIDARRMEVYCSVLTPSLVAQEPTQAKIIDSESFSEQLSAHSILFFGDGASKCKSVITHPNANFLDSVTLGAQNMGELASQKFSGKQFENLALFEPNYLKEFVAKTKLA